MTTLQRACRNCGIARDIDDFRRLRKDCEKRVAVCRECRNLIDKTRYRKSRDASIHQATIESLVRLQNRSSLARRIVFLDELLARYGGPARFAKEVKRVFDETGDRRIQFRCLQVAVDVMTACAKDRETMSEADSHEHDQSAEASFGRCRN